MLKSLRFAVSSAFAVLLDAAGAEAAVMTFKNLPPAQEPTIPTYREDGITVTPTGGFLGSFGVPEAQHLDDGATVLARTVTFTMAIRFEAVSLDVLASSNVYCADIFDGPCGVPYDNVKVEGIRGGSVVAETAFYMGGDGSSMTVLLGALFSNLDALAVTALLHDIAEMGGGCLNIPCGHFDIDNVRLDPVPLPAGLPLMAAALAGLGFAGRRRTRGAVTA